MGGRLIVCTLRDLLVQLGRVETLRFQHVRVELIPAPTVIARQKREDIILGSCSFGPRSAVDGATPTESLAGDEEEGGIVLPWDWRRVDLVVELCCVEGCSVCADIRDTRILVHIITNLNHQDGYGWILGETARNGETCETTACAGVSLILSWMIPLCQLISG